MSRVFSVILLPTAEAIAGKASRVGAAPSMQG